MTMGVGASASSSVMISPALVSEAEAMKELMKEVSIGRLGRPEEIAAAVFL
jgi:hypothetical protein